MMLLHENLDRSRLIIFSITLTVVLIPTLFVYWNMNSMSKYRYQVALEFQKIIPRIRTIKSGTASRFPGATKLILPRPMSVRSLAEENFEKVKYYLQKAYLHDIKRDVVITLYSPKIVANARCAVFDEKKRLISVNRVKPVVKFMYDCGVDNSTYDVLEIISNAYVIFYTAKTNENNRTDFTDEKLLPITNLALRKVELLEGKRKLEELAVSVIIFGSPQIMMVVQLVEWYLMQGASKVLFSDLKADIHNSIWRVMEFYPILGVAEIRDYHPKCKHVDAEHFHHLTLHESLLDSMYFYRYVAVVDIDELIQPADPNLNLVSLLHRLDTGDRAMFRFPAVYSLTHESPPHVKFEKMAATEDFVVKNLPLLRYNFRATKCVDLWYSPKTIVKPEYINEMGLHGGITFLHNKKMHDVACPTSSDTNSTTLDYIGYMNHVKSIPAWGENHLNDTEKMCSYVFRSYENSHYNLSLQYPQDQLTSNVAQRLPSLIQVLIPKSVTQYFVPNFSNDMQ